MNNQFDVQKSGGNFTNMASLAPLPLQPPRVLDQKVTNFTQEQQQKQQQQQQQNNNNQEPLRCPRCDSSNTKFCYYNNYSLSQPRHFCKACKRYWTRGGTLRSVPVGGGCRKNKRVKRPSNNSNNNTSSMITTNNNNTNYSNNLHDGSVNSLPSTNNNNNTHIHDLINTSASNPLFYGINHGSNHHNFMNNFPFSRYDLPQINGVGLGFSSGLVHNDNINGDFRNGLSLNPHNNNNNNKHIFQDLISSNPNTSSISSLLASSFQMKSGGNNNFETILPSYEGNHHMKGGMFMKEVKMELEGQNRAMDQHWSAPSQNLLDQSNIGSSPSSDPSHVWGNGPNLGSWVDPSQNNLGCSSFPSLI